MKFWLKVLHIKSLWTGIYYAFKTVFELLVNFITVGKSSPKFIENQYNQSTTINLLWFTAPIWYITKSIITINKSLIQLCVKKLKRAYKNSVHYYSNYYSKGRSVINLYPEYQNVSISKAVKLVLLPRDMKEFNLFSSLTLFMSFISKWVFPMLMGGLLLILLFTLRDIPVNKFLFIAVSLGFFTYLLLSGFVFFLKKYKYSKYTTAMHRYWRRTFSIFWLLEGYLFLVFLYLTVFSNQEPFFAYDNIQFFKDLTYPWRLFIQEAAMLIFIIALLRFALLRLKDISVFKLYSILFIVSTIIFMMTWVEFYQFYYTLNYYNSIDWAYDEDSFTWSMELETKKTRILLHFITMCIIAKFWHFIFILGFWMFSMCRWLQLNTVHYALLSANLQNFIILYLLNWIVMYPWVKYLFRRYLFKNYTWLYSNFRTTGSRVFFIDFINYAHTLIITINPFSVPLSFTVVFNYLLCCWNLNGASFSFEGFKVFTMHYVNEHATDNN